MSRLLQIVLLLCACTGLLSAQAQVSTNPLTTPAAPPMPSPILSMDAARAFDAANQLYDVGKYTEAAARYEAILRSGQTSSALYFNLGNAWFKAGGLGRAIAAYRRAEQLEPRDPDLRANLRFARNQVQGSTLLPGPAQRFLGRLSLGEWTCAAAGSVWVFFALLTAGQLRPALKRPLRNYVLAEALVALLFCSALGAALQQDRSNPTAIVVTRDAVVRQGPLDESKSVFTAHDGAELQVLDQKDNWLQVTTDSQHLGWVRRDEVVLGNGLI